MEYFDDKLAPAGTITEKVVELDLTRSVDTYRASHGVEPSACHVMAYVQRAWVLNPDKANQAELILACANITVNGTPMRRILGVFQIGRNGNDGFVKSPWSGDGERCVFLAEPADANLIEKYKDRYLAPRQKGEVNPIKYNY